MRDGSDGDCEGGVCGFRSDRGCGVDVVVENAARELGMVMRRGQRGGIVGGEGETYQFGNGFGGIWSGRASN